jgi:hypothetical protein
MKQFFHLEKLLNHQKKFFDKGYPREMTKTLINAELYATLERLTTEA